MTGPKIEDSEKCDKPFKFGDALLCGFAFPSDPSCQEYHSNDELIEVIDGGEKTRHRPCYKANGGNGKEKDAVLKSPKEYA